MFSVCALFGFKTCWARGPRVMARFARRSVPRGAVRGGERTERTSTYFCLRTYMKVLVYFCVRARLWSSATAKWDAQKCCGAVGCEPSNIAQAIRQPAPVPPELAADPDDACKPRTLSIDAFTSSGGEGGQLP